MKYGGNYAYQKNSLFFTFYEKLGHVFIKMRMYNDMSYEKSYQLFICSGSDVLQSYFL